MNLDEAVQQHAGWKLKFRIAISKNEQMDAATISKDNCCMVGQCLDTLFCNKVQDLYYFRLRLHNILTRHK